MARQPAIHKKHRHVKRSQTRIIVRPYEKPPKMYYISALGVFQLHDFVWGKRTIQALEAKGYKKQLLGRSEFIFERTR